MEYNITFKCSDKEMETIMSSASKMVEMAVESATHDDKISDLRQRYDNSCRELAEKESRIRELQREVDRLKGK